MKRFIFALTSSFAFIITAEANSKELDNTPGVDKIPVDYPYSHPMDEQLYRNQPSPMQKSGTQPLKYTHTKDINHLIQEAGWLSGVIPT